LPRCLECVLVTLHWRISFADRVVWMRDGRIQRIDVNSEAEKVVLFQFAIGAVICNIAFLSH
jgi:hypothetical protein